jgi:hypothetical protein
MRAMRDLSIFINILSSFQACFQSGVVHQMRAGFVRMHHLGASNRFIATAEIRHDAEGDGTEGWL